MIHVVAARGKSIQRIILLRHWFWGVEIAPRGGCVCGLFGEDAQAEKQMKSSLRCRWLA